MGQTLSGLWDSVKGSFAADKEARNKATESAEQQTAQRTAEPGKALLRWIAKLGAGVVSGLGLAGVVGLIGSAVLWARFDQAGLPATQALAVVPDDQRLIEGAATLAPALIIAALAVMALFSLDRTGRINLWSYIALGVLLVGAVVASCSAEIPDSPTAGLIALAFVLAGASIGIGKVTGTQYVPFAFAVFISTVVFAGALNFAIAAHQNFIQPAAVLKNIGGQGIVGLYVTDDEEFIYIGVVRGPQDETACERAVPEDSVPLYRIPRTQTTRLLIGRRQSYASAVCELVELRGELVEGDDVGGPLLPSEVTLEE